MSRFYAQRSVARWLIVGVLGGLWVGMAGADTAVAQPPAIPSLEMKTPPAADFTLAEGLTPEQIFARIGEWAQLQPAEQTQEAFVAHLTKVSTAILAAADRILSGQAAEGDLLRAVNLKYQMLQLRADLLQEPAAKTTAMQFTQSLLADSRPFMARQGKLKAFTMQAEGYGDLNPGAQQTFLTDIVTFVKAEPITPETVQLAMQVADAVDTAGASPAAAQLYMAFAEHFKSGPPPVAEQIVPMMISSARRLGLVGNELRLTGSLTTGEALDFSTYRGKVVVVDFWATWCGPCREALPALKKIYEKYHPHGLEVIGVSVDETMPEVTAFLTEEKLPWPTLFDASNTEQANAEYYGIQAIPTMFVVGRDGKVIKSDAWAEDLEEVLAPLFPNVPAEPAAP